MKRFILPAFVALSLVACNKKQLQENKAFDEDQKIAEASFESVASETDAAIATAEAEAFNTYQNESYAYDDSCVIITVELSSDETYIAKLTLDFGDGCISPTTGRERKGKIIVTQNGRRIDVGTERIVTFEDFYLDDYKVEGIRTVTTKTVDLSNLILDFTVDVSDGKITTPAGDEITWESNRTRRWAIEGGKIKFKILTDGTISGTNRNGIDYSAKVTADLVRVFPCKWFSEGIIELTPDGLKTRTLDFGDGTCDDQATVSVGKKSYDITLK